MLMISGYALGGTFAVLCLAWVAASFRTERAYRGSQNMQALSNLRRLRAAYANRSR